MPAGPRPASRPGAGPGRGRSRARTQARERVVVSRPPSEEDSLSAGPVAVLRRGIQANLTARALALVVVLLVLTISYATSLRIYFAQAHQIAETRSQIVQSQAAIDSLRNDLARWDDPAYVRTQARDRLGWVLPGETGYTVVGADGKPLGGGESIASASSTTDTPKAAWWGKLWGSVETADNPAPAKPDPAKVAPVTENSKPR